MMIRIRRAVTTFVIAQVALAREHVSRRSIDTLNTVDQAIQCNRNIRTLRLSNSLLPPQLRSDSNHDPKQIKLDGRRLDQAQRCLSADEKDIFSSSLHPCRSMEALLFLQTVWSAALYTTWYSTVGHHRDLHSTKNQDKRSTQRCFANKLLRLFFCLPSQR